MSIEIHALIFDMDGVLTDTVDLHYEAWLRLAREKGIPPEHVDKDQLRGLSRWDSLQTILRGQVISAAEADALMLRKNVHFLELLEQLSPADCLPGVQRILAEARSAGLKLGLASSSQNVYAVLDKLQLLDAFDAIADAFTITHTKPAPDVFLWMAGRLNVRPVNAVVFEDSSVGIEAAHSGGFWSVGIGAAQNVGQARLVVPNLENLPVAELAQRLADSSTNHKIARI